MIVKIDCVRYDSEKNECKGCKDLKCKKCKFYESKNKANIKKHTQEKSFNGYFLRDVVCLFSKN